MKKHILTCKGSANAVQSTCYWSKFSTAPNLNTQPKNYSTERKAAKQLHPTFT